MKSEYKKLVNDVINFVKDEKSLFFDESYKIKNKTIRHPPLKLVSQKIAPPNQKNIATVEKPKAETPLPKAEKTQVVEQKPTPIKNKRSYLDKPNEVLTDFDQFKDVYRQVSTIDPDYELRQSILDDSMAKKIENKWKYKLNAHPVTILSATKDENELKFLQSVAKAIEVHFFETKVVAIDSIEKENQWDEFLESENIRLIIAVDDQIWNYKNLMKRFKEIPNQSLKTLGDIPIFLIPNLLLYFQNFKLKKSLWKALCQTIAEL